ncbi:unnamed protein product [Notodromas monacha]|uniref:KRR1 small subunit processome component homolog n=1 Tax=Notodromas monacha TaxID=399045 RepID=A0A7R9GA20_9CRUS|nr:unnamed protein product [Notodromas monacha]CAG0914858.1 unnamed protein product [Notodromas monacha]
MENDAENKPVENAWALKVPSFTKEDVKPCLVEESSFATLFPKYREKYLKECWSLVQTLLKEHELKADLDLLEGSMSVRTTRKTWDPYIILKARDFIQLLARSVPYEHAAKVLDDDVFCEIIRIGKIVRNKARFVKRRQRLIGPNGATLKAIELLTGCYVLIQGNTVSAIGPWTGLKHVRSIVMDTMNNIHPIYHIKALMIKRELAKDPNLKNESWDRFVPKFPNRSVKSKKIQKKKKPKKDYTPFPPEQQESKIDQQIASGEYFLEENERKRKQEYERRQKEVVKTKERKEKKMLKFIPPPERETRVLEEKSRDVDIKSLKAPDIMDTVEEELKQFNMAGECVGGGRIIHDPVDKTIEVFGYSQGYGRADHAIATEVLKKVYPIYKISWKNDGY